MPKVKRYGVRWMEYFLTSEPDIVEVADGEFVPFKDYDELRERVSWMMECDYLCHRRDYPLCGWAIVEIEHSFINSKDAVEELL